MWGVCKNLEWVCYYGIKVWDYYGTIKEHTEI